MNFNALCHNLNTKVYTYKSLHKELFVIKILFYTRYGWFIKTGHFFFNYSIAYFYMLLSVCNRTIMKSPLLIWERIPSISMRETVILLSVGVLKLSIPVISTPHDVLWRRSLSEPHWFLLMWQWRKILASPHQLISCIRLWWLKLIYFFILCTFVLTWD